MTIAELAPGQSGVIAAYRGADAEERHLLDMGLTPGVRVRLIGTALLGDPLILLVRGSRVSIRRRLARQIILSARTAAKRRCSTPSRGCISMWATGRA